MKRTFDIDLRVCVRCGGRLTIRTRARHRPLFTSTSDSVQRSRSERPLRRRSAPASLAVCIAGNWARSWNCAAICRPRAKSDAPQRARASWVWSGLHVYDTRTGALTDVANLQGRDFVRDFDMGPDGLVFAAGTLAEPDDIDGASRYAIARWTDGETTRRVVELRGRPAHFFRRGDDVLLQFPADDSTTGYDRQDSGGRTHAVFSLAGDRPVLERWLNELPEAAGPQIIDREVIHADATSYYVIAHAQGFANVDRLSRQGSAEYSAIASIDVRPIFDGNRIDWVPADDRSTVRRRALEESASESVEVVFDARRQVQAFALAGCRLAWISASAVDAAEPFRLMVGRSR